MAEQAIEAGTRVRCENCGSEAVVVRAGGPELRCCGAELTVLSRGRPSS